MASSISRRDHKNARVRQAAETTNIIESGICGTHDISSSIAAACNSTQVYKAGTLSDVSLFERSSTSIQVTGEMVQAATFRLCSKNDADVAVLNFASARKPCGGFKSGAKSQEEDLARSSALSACVCQDFVFDDYYQPNRSCKSVLYLDTIVYSRRVPFFRNGLTDDICDPFFASIITAPALNVGAYKKAVTREKMKELYRRRLLYVLNCALKHGHKTLVLGAWGCGVFRFPPDLAAECYQELLDDEFQGAFERIVFAVYDGAQGPGPCFEAFNKVFGKIEDIRQELSEQTEK